MKSVVVRTITSSGYQYMTQFPNMKLAMLYISIQSKIQAGGTQKSKFKVVRT